MKTKFKFNNGDKVKDIITDVEGIVTGNVDYITGCKQCLISPKDNDASWYDQDRLKLIKKKAIVIDVRDNGFDKQAPIK